MAILNLEYYTQKDLYSDGDIEEQMLKMAKEGVTCEELSSEQVSFPVIYHFSDCLLYTSYRYVIYILAGLIAVTLVVTIVSGIRKHMKKKKRRRKS